jgi:hypothetical protein
MLSIPYLEFGKTAAVRASDRGKFQTLADINKPGVVAVSNPGGMIVLYVLLHTQEKSDHPLHGKQNMRSCHAMDDQRFGFFKQPTQNEITVR